MITLLYASLLGLLQVTLAYKVGSSRLKTNTLLGDGNQSEVLQKVRAHGNLTEYVPIFLILLALIEMQGVALWKIHVLGSLFFWQELPIAMACIFQLKVLLQGLLVF